LAGALKLRLSPASPDPIVEGNLRSVEGSFEAYGREFRIERGVLIFAGAVDNPAVNVRAVRELNYEGEAIKIGVQLTGTLEQLQTRLFREPAMSESDALAYLILNRPLQRSDNLASEQLSGAAVALGLANMLPVTEQLRDTLGLDEIEFAGMTRESSVVTAGKRIGDDFYIRYTYGLFERIGRFVIRYNIGRGFSLEAGSGQEQTIDLLYSVDR
jgi:translocation and assembly module TamB